MFIQCCWDTEDYVGKNFCLDISHSQVQMLHPSVYHMLRSGTISERKHKHQTRTLHNIRCVFTTFPQGKPGMSVHTGWCTPGCGPNLPQIGKRFVQILHMHIVQVNPRNVSGRV